MRICAIWLLMLAVTGAAQAANVTLRNAWVRLPPPGATVAAAYFKLHATQAARLVGARAPAVAGAVELHRMSMQNGIMRMRQLDGLTLDAGQTIPFAPSGLHLMLVDLKNRLKVGDEITLELDFAPTLPGGKVETVRAVAIVKPAN